MTDNRKQLKSAAYLVLFLAALSFVRMIVNVFKTDFKSAGVQAGVSEEIASIAMIVTCVIGFALLLPQIYVGVKGVKVANNAGDSKAHIVWAIILGIFAVMGLASPIKAMLSGDLLLNLLDVISRAIDVLAYTLYTVFAIKVAKE